MRFMVDECTGPKVAQWLRDQGYEVFSVFDEARGIDDEKIIKKAFNENFILVTNDKDFGEKVFRERRPHRGIIFLRLEDESSVSKINTLQRLFKNYENQLIDQFIIVSETKVRFSLKNN